MRTIIGDVFMVYLFVEYSDQEQHNTANANILPRRVAYVAEDVYVSRL